jgi:hypothetical protein
MRTKMPTTWSSPSSTTKAGPRSPGQPPQQAPSPINPQVSEALVLLEERFKDITQDGPRAYAAFLAAPDDDEEDEARLRREAIATTRAFVAGFRAQHR